MSPLAACAPHRTWHLTQMQWRPKKGRQTESSGGGPLSQKMEQFLLASHPLQKKKIFPACGGLPGGRV